MYITKTRCQLSFWTVFKEIVFCIYLFWSLWYWEKQICWWVTGDVSWLQRLKVESSSALLSVLVFVVRLWALGLFQIGEHENLLCSSVYINIVARGIFFLNWSLIECVNVNLSSVLSFLLEEILVLGTGAQLERIDPSVLALLRRKGIGVEVQDTVKHKWYLVCL